MTVLIVPIEDHNEYKVNAHTIRNDINFGYMSQITELSKTEKKAFQTYRALIIDNPRFKKHPRSTYKSH